MIDINITTNKTIGCCPKCSGATRVTHEQYWCSNCLIGYTIIVNLGDLLSEMAIAKHQNPKIRDMIESMNTKELLDYAIEHLALMLTADHTHILDALCIVRSKMNL